MRFLSSRFNTFWYNFRWSDWVRYIDGWIPRFSVTVPIVGYLILFNDSIAGHVVFTNLIGSPFAFGLDGGERLRFVYFGLWALGVSNVLFHFRKPHLFRYGVNPVEFTRTGLEHFTYQDFLQMHHTIRHEGHLTLDGKYYDSEWDGFKEASLNKGEGTDRVERTGSWEGAQSKYGSLLRSILNETFFRGDTGRRGWLATCVLLSTVGYALLVVPSIDLFVKVMLSTLPP